MGQGKGAGGTAVAGAREPEQIREEIERTRQQLGDTVEALAAKTDVAAQVRNKLEAVGPLPLAILGAVAAGLLVRRMLRG